MTRTRMVSMTKKKTIVSLLVGLGAWLSVSNAFAQGQGDKAAADVLFTDAEKLVEASQFAQACPKFAESQRLDPQLGTLLHLADCYEKNGQTASAWASFREAKELASTKSDQRESIAKDRAAALEPKLSRLSLVVPSESEVHGLEITRDGQTVNKALWGTAVPVDPGKHTVVAKAEGRQTWTKDIEVKDPGKTVTLAIPALAAGAPLPPPVVAPVVAPKPAEKPLELPKTGGSPLKIVGFVLAGVGAAGRVTGGITAGSVSSKSSEADAICPTGVGCTVDEVNRYNLTYAEAQDAQTLSTIAFIGGGVLLAAGVVMILVAPSSSSSSSSAARAFARPGVITW